MFQDGCNSLPSTHSISRPSRYSWSLPSQYLFAIGLALYLALGAYNHPFTLHYQTALLEKRARCTGLLPSADLPFRRLPTIPHNRLAPLPLGLVRLRSPLLPESPLFSSPPSSDMLKSKGLSRCRAIRTRAEKCHSRPVSQSAASFVAPRANRSLECAVYHTKKPKQSAIDPAAGSPTATLLRLVSNLMARILAAEPPSSALSS